ncbi:MAG: hypothetical protein AB1540_16210 [Bdellovibrionota bacterium]
MLKTQSHGRQLLRIYVLSTFFIGLTFSGCGGERYLDREKNHPQYHEGNAAPGLLVPNTNVRVAADWTNALAAVTAASLSANPEFYRKSTIGGRCILKSSASDRLGLPCVNLVLVLSEVDGKEVSRRPTSQKGEFLFPVEKNKKYALAVASEKLKAASDLKGPFVMGDEVVLTLEVQEEKAIQKTNSK